MFFRQCSPVFFESHMQLKFRKLSNFLNVSTNLMVVTRSKAVSPTRVYHVTLTLNPSPRGRDLPSPAWAQTSVFRIRNLFQFHAKVTISVDNCSSAEYFHCKSSAIAAILYDDLLIFCADSIFVACPKAAGPTRLFSTLPSA